MRAVVVTQPGGPEVLELQDRPTPEPGAGEVRVDVRAAGVNFTDVYQRSGLYAVPTPFVLGSEGSGVISAVGADVTDLAVGQRVAWAQAAGELCRAGHRPRSGCGAGPRRRSPTTSLPARCCRA